MEYIKQAEILNSHKKIDKKPHAPNYQTTIIFYKSHVIITGYTVANSGHFPKCLYCDKKLKLYIEIIGSISN